jgi:hypothetical protein
MLVARVVLSAFPSSRQVLIADMAELVSVESFARVRVVLAAGRCVVAPADVVFGLGPLPFLLLVEGDEGPRALPFPRSPGVRKLVCG